MLRLFLALSVVAAHAESTVFGMRGLDGHYAVEFFFVISGFFMAMVLNTRYKDSDPIHFYLNRALRLLPTYYIGLVLALLVSFPAILQFYNQLAPGARAFYLFQNLFLFGQDVAYFFCSPLADGSGCANPVNMAMNPPTWSLAVECMFFIVAPFIVKSARRTWLMVLVGALYCLALHRIGFPIHDVPGVRYATVFTLGMYFYPASFIFFGGGALAYHLSKRTAPPPYWALVLLAVLLAFSHTWMPGWHMMLIALAVPVLFHYTRNSRFDRVLGDITYPAYIYHFPLLMLMSPLMQAHPHYFGGLTLGSVVAVMTMGLGYLSHTLIENRINAYRRSIGMQKDERELLGNRHPTPWPRYAPVVVALYALVPAPVVLYVFQAQAAQRHLSWLDALRHGPHEPDLKPPPSKLTESDTQAANE